MPRVGLFDILADDPNRVSSFYREVFDWEIQRREGPPGCWLVVTGPDGTPGINGGIIGRHFPQPIINTIEVESLQQALAKMEQGGVAKIHGPNEILGVGLQAY